MITRYQANLIKLKKKLNDETMSSGSENADINQSETGEFGVNSQLGGPGYSDDTTMTETPATESTRAGEQSTTVVRREEPALNPQLMAILTALTNKIDESSTQLREEITQQLSNKIDETNTELRKQMTDNNTQLSKLADKVEENNKRAEENHRQLQNKFIEHTQQVKQTIQDFRAETTQMMSDMRAETRGLMQEEVDAVKKTLADSIKEVKETMIKEDKEIEKRVARVSKRMDETSVKLTQIGEQLTASGTQQKKRAEEVDEKINKVNEAQKEMNVKLAKIGDAPVARGSQVEPTKNVLFNGEGEFPIEFLKELDEIKEAFHGDRDTKWIRQYLEKDAALWWQLIKDQISSYAEFQAAFREKFWSPIIQDGVRDFLEYGKFNYNDGLTPIQYMQRRILEARQLVPAMTDRHIINKIARHYSHDVLLAVITRGIHDVTAFENLLREFATVKWPQARVTTQSVVKGENEQRRRYSEEREEANNGRNKGKFHKNKNWHNERPDVGADNGRREGKYMPSAPPCLQVIETDGQPSTSKDEPRRGDNGQSKNY